MELSVVIPTYRRPEKLARCLQALSRQVKAPEFEVLVGFDGADPEGHRSAIGAWSGPAGNLRVLEWPRSGQPQVRNRLLELCRGRVLVGFNDDMRPEPGCLAAHAREHEASRVRGQRVIVLGSAPWVVHEPDTLFARLVRETSMVFFFNRMDTPEGLADRDRDWGFRHCWALNFSAPMDAVREVGGFTVFPSWYGFEDDEIAWKINKRYGSPVLYRPEARAWHDHKMVPREYLEREFKLGYAAVGFARTSPECARAMFGRDIAAAPELSYSREYLRREESGVGRIMETFEKLGSMPAGVLDGAHGATVRDLGYQQHLPLKRWMWRAGLVAAAEAREMVVVWPVAH